MKLRDDKGVFNVTLGLAAVAALAVMATIGMWWRGNTYSAKLDGANQTIAVQKKTIDDGIKKINVIQNAKDTAIQDLQKMVDECTEMSSKPCITMVVPKDATFEIVREPGKDQLLDQLREEFK